MADPLNADVGGEEDNVKVAVRCRPLSQLEISQGHKSTVNVDDFNNTISVANSTNPNEPPKIYTFDHVFGVNSDQMTVYNKVARTIVENVLKGYNGTIFAYGQTGTGKTFTMSGDMEQPDKRGIIPNSFVHIFDQISKCKQDKTFLVSVSYLEIYNEEIRDLLTKSSKHGLEIKERPGVGVFVKDLSHVAVSNADHMYRIMELGMANRHVGATNMNEVSSRSHALFTVTIECSAGSGATQHVTQGKLHLVDLAGSERQSKTGATGDRLKEASKINLSLSTLGNVISALVDSKSSHIPYRNSKLTRLLQDSLGGNSKTLMIANIGPASYNYDETISTLRYANRAKNIKNVARINEDPKDALIRKYQEKIDELKKQLDYEETDEETDEDENVHRQAGAANWDEKIREIESELETKRQLLSREKDMAENEKHKLVHDIESKEEELHRCKDEHKRLLEKLATMEKKLIVGGENMLEKAEKQAKLLEDSKKELERAQMNESELRKRLESRQAEHLDIEEKYNTLQEEAAGKSRKLKKVWATYMQLKGEIADMDSEHQREMEGLLDNVRQLQRELKLYSLIIETYVPDKYSQIIDNYVFWNEDIGDWQLKCIAYTGNNMRSQKPSSAPLYKQPAALAKPSYLSYADATDSPANSKQISSPNRGGFRPKSAKKDRNSARIRALLN